MLDHRLASGNLPNGFLYLSKLYQTLKERTITDDKTDTTVPIIDRDDSVPPPDLNAPN
jgi:hypothetical protein